VLLGIPMLYDEEGTGGTGVTGDTRRADQATPTPTPSPSPSLTRVPVHLAASGPLAAAPAASGPFLSFVGRIGPSQEARNARHVAVSGGSVRALAVPAGGVAISDDREDLLVADPDRRLYTVPLDRIARFRRLGNAVSVLGSRGDRVYVTFAAEGSAGVQVRVLGRTDGELLDRRYLPLAAGEIPVGIVDSGKTVAVIVRTRGQAAAGTLVLRWPDGQQVLLTRNGRFLGASAGTAVVRPGPDECAPPARLCVLVVQPGPVTGVRRGFVVVPHGWSPELGGQLPVGFAGGVVVFPVRSATTGAPALAAAATSNLVARLVPGSRDVVPGSGVVSTGRYVVWGVDAQGRVAPVYWDASQPALPARRLAPTMPAPFQFICACP
jgi:hypothetical protein